ncbi:hypothetical protein [Paenibacillus protaetiae]|uniref:Uncharacterized protein n=1 Tax=Paenibacillus protaetiae TaxID=2509456 RepID=A0A4P6F2I1_9BACL|nr:hypothetical protein [Paenibacillus protaetiae]QAY67297.1 hypothetical protein ET464_13700 [Paenibacillus protaetiae]
MNCPEGDVGTRLLEAALYDETAIEFFRTYFKRPYVVNDRGHTMYPGFETADANSLIDFGKEGAGRFKIKLSQPVVEQLTELQIALGLSFFAHAAKLLIEYALRNLTIIQKVAPGMEWVKITRIEEPAEKLVAVTNQKGIPNVWSIFK